MQTPCVGDNVVAYPENVVNANFILQWAEVLSELMLLLVDDDDDTKKYWLK